MEDALKFKINRIIKNKEYTDEDKVRSMMVMVRKLIDKMKQARQNKYLILRLFCNWSVHDEITQSITGYRILANVNNALGCAKKNNDLSIISKVIGFTELREEFKSFISYYGIENYLTSCDKEWNIFLDNLIEIISYSPLSFPALSKLKPEARMIYDDIANNAIHPGSGVISIQVGQGELYIRTEDAKHIIVSLEI